MQTRLQLLGPEACLALAETLPDIAEHTIGIHALRTGRCRAFSCVGRRGAVTALVDPFVTPGDVIAFGEDAETIIATLFAMGEWRCVEVPMPLADSVGEAMKKRLGRPAKRTVDIFYVLRRPAAPAFHPQVRLLTAADEELYATSAPAFEDTPEDLRRNLREGPIAAAIIEGKVVSAVEANIRTGRHANLAAETSRESRGQGLCTAAACVVAAEVQRMGLVPVWSATETNAASRRVAEKTGFVEASRWVYLG